MIVSSMTRGGHPGKKKHGTNRTKGYHSSRHRHENKRVVVEEKALNAIERDNVTTIDIIENPLPEIVELTNDEISEIIREVTGHFEDTFQDVWVAVIERNLNDPEEIRKVAKECNIKDAKKVTGEHYKQFYGDIPLNPETNTTRFDLMGDNDEQIELFLNDNEPEETRTKLFKKHTPLTRFLLQLKKQIDRGHIGKCIMCEENSLINSENHCLDCSETQIGNNYRGYKTGRPKSTYRLYTEWNITREELKNTYHSEGLSYTSKLYSITPWALLRIIDSWNIPRIGNGKLAPNARIRMANKISAIRRREHNNST